MRKGSPVSEAWFLYPRGAKYVVHDVRGGHKTLVALKNKDKDRNAPER